MFTVFCVCVCVCVCVCEWCMCVCVSHSGIPHSCCAFLYSKITQCPHCSQQSTFLTLCDCYCVWVSVAVFIEKNIIFQTKQRILDNMLFFFLSFIQVRLRIP